MNLVEKVKRNIKSQSLLKKRNKVVVGVSGGADSVCLLHILYQIQYDLGVNLSVAHYNHNLRKSSDRDKNFVKNLAEDLNIPFYCKSWNNPNIKAKGSLEEKAREKRLKFFVEITKKTNADTVALAHTENDLAETVLMRLLRGTGLLGLRGIMPIKKMEGVTFIRPLLSVSRDEIENFLKKNKLSFRTDPTNKETYFFRNKIRLKLLPLLQSQYNKNISNVLLNIANTAEHDYDYIEKAATKIFNQIKKNKRPHQIAIPLKCIQKKHTAIQRMVIRKSVEQLKGNTNALTFSHIQNIENLIQSNSPNWIVNLPNRISISKRSDHLLVTLK